MSHVACHVSFFLLLFFVLDKAVELVGGGSVIDGAHSSLICCYSSSSIYTNHVTCVPYS